MVYDTQITIVNGIYKPTNITGGPQMSRNPQQKKNKQTNMVDAGRCWTFCEGIEPPLRFVNQLVRDSGAPKNLGCIKGLLTTNNHK